MFKLYINLVVIFNILKLSFSASILGVILTPLLSHNAPFQPLWRELSQRGHNVTVLTSHPIGDPSLINLTEINLRFSLEAFKNWEIFEKFIKGVDVAESVRIVRGCINETTTLQLEYEPVKRLLHSNKHFDVVLAEVQISAALGFAWRFKCPCIGISSLEAPLQYHYTMGNPVHPAFQADFNFPVWTAEGLSFAERFLSLLYNYLYVNHFVKSELDELSVSQKKYFGADMPHMQEILNNMSMLFITTNPMTHDIRPLQPNTIQIGTGLHFKKIEVLPKDIQEFLDKASNGVIYFSLGSNVNHSMLMPSFFNNILHGLSELPYHVLFKTDVEMNDVPKNFMTAKWLPQQDLLCHTNLKLFITHAGLQSLQETIYNGVPVVVIPLFGDGFGNANKAIRMGYGLKLDAKSVTKEEFKNAVLEVIENPMYRNNIMEARRIFRDIEVPGIQRAVYWTEYVIRHKGARHLRNPYLNAPLWKYYMLDVFGLAVLVLVLAIYLFYRLGKWSLHIIFRKPVLDKIHKD